MIYKLLNMKKLSIIIVAVFISLSFSSKETKLNNALSNETVQFIQQEIAQLNQIIDNKHDEARLLEIEAEQLMKRNNEKAIILIKQVNLLKSNCHKYQAAIACKKRFLIN